MEVLMSMVISVALLDFFMDYMSSHLTSFELLWKIFRQEYLTLFYPDICKELGIKDKDDGMYAMIRFLHCVQNFS
jgi:hypothetical protein